MYPILFELGEFKIFSYPFFMGLAWGLALRLCLPGKGKRVAFWTMVAGLFVSSWVGAKVVFLLVSSSRPLGHYLGSGNFWSGGGLVFYGGLLAALAFVLFYTLALKKYPLEDTAAFFPAMGYGHAVGRLGCALAGCCYGKSCDLPWATAGRHPVQLYEAALLLALAGTCDVLLKKGASFWRIAGVYLFAYAAFRFGLEYLRGDVIRGIHLMGLSTSQLFSLGLGATIACVWLWRRSGPPVQTKK